MGVIKKGLFSCSFNHHGYGETISSSPVGQKEFPRKTYRCYKHGVTQNAIVFSHYDASGNKISSHPFCSDCFIGFIQAHIGTVEEICQT